MPEEGWTFDKMDTVLESISKWWHSYFLPIVLDELNTLPEPYKCVLRCHFIGRMEGRVVVAVAKLNSLEDFNDCLLTGVEMLTKRVISMEGARRLTTGHIVSILTTIGLQEGHESAKIFINQPLFYPYLN